MLQEKTRTDAISLIAERKITEAIDKGLLENLPPCGRIDCSLHGDAFLRKWWGAKGTPFDNLR
jgi:hypothetical protein